MKKRKNLISISFIIILGLSIYIITCSEKKDSNLLEPVNPVLTVSPTELNFGESTISETLLITNSGSGTLTWGISENIDWLEVSPISGTTTSETDSVIVTVSRSELTADTHIDTITVTSGNSIKTISVSITVSQRYLLINNKWAMYSCKLGSTDLLQIVEPCGRNDTLFFNDDGTCYVKKNGCPNITGNWQLNTDGTILTFTKDSIAYEYLKSKLDNTQLIITYLGYAEALTETYSSVSK